MITHNKLIELGFSKVNQDSQIFYINGWIKLEKCFCGYICQQPYKIVSTIDELKNIMK